MPFYPLECKKCGHKYDIMSSMSEREQNVKKAKCPECKSKSKLQLIANCNFMFSNPVGTDRHNNSHDYRFHWEMDREGGVREQRQVAEESSHVGPSPYNDIDDVSSGDYFGEVE